MARNKARRTLFQLPRSHLERGVDLGEVPLRCRAQLSESAPATIQAMTRSSEGSPMTGAYESPGRSTSTRRAWSSAGCWPSSANAGGYASGRGGEEHGQSMRVLGDGREKKVKEKEPRVEPRPRRSDTSEEKPRRSANRANVPAS
jgi:hypothetical protein